MMNVDNAGIASAAAIIAFAWTAIQIGDRLWWRDKRKPTHDEMTSNMHDLLVSRTELLSALAVNTNSVTTLNQSMAQVNSLIVRMADKHEAHEELAAERHRTLIDEIRRRA